MVRFFVILGVGALTLPAVLEAQSSDTEGFIQVGAGAAPESPAIGAAVGIRIPIAHRLQVTGRILGWNAVAGGCNQSVPESFSCDIGGFGAALGLRGRLPEVGAATPFVELSGGGFRSEVAGESNIDPHAALEVGVSFDITSSIQANLAVNHLRVFGSYYEELLDESLTFTGGVLGISIPVTR